MPDELSTDEIAKLVDAAAEILADSGAKMPCRELVRIAVNTGMWNKPGSPATAMTLYNAMLAECREKPHPRFKICPEFQGHFEVNP